MKLNTFGEASWKLKRAAIGSKHYAIKSDLRRGVVVGTPVNSINATKSYTTHTCLDCPALIRHGKRCAPCGVTFKEKGNLVNPSPIMARVYKI